MDVLLDRALDGRALPPGVVDLLVAVRAPARLGAHLRLVHDVAWELTGWLATSRLTKRLVFDREAVLFGAATHDIGKVLYPQELSAPGDRHEAAGRDLLLAHGVQPRLARFAGTHGSWDAAGVTVEDLLVSVADKVWKAKRVEDLERLLLDRIAQAGDVPVWEAFVALDDCLDRLAAGADERLAFQNAFPVGGP